MILFLLLMMLMARAQSTERLSDCMSIRDSSSNSGSGNYKIYPRGIEMDVWCDMESNGGGWTYFQRRFDGSVDFFRNWASYEEGFGDADGGEYWLGNRNLHTLTQLAPMELRINLEAHDGSAYAEYSSVSVAGRGDNFRLSLSGYKTYSTAGDSMIDYHNGQPFSTFDRDHDIWERNCAAELYGAWWYLGCSTSNLNGLYYYTDANQGITGNRSQAGMVYQAYKHSSYYSFKTTNMGVRPRCSTRHPNVIISWSPTSPGTATFSCAARYERVSGDQHKTCYNNGAWSGSRFACQLSNCETLTAPNNGEVTLRGIGIGQIATYTCDTGYGLNGVESRTCQRDGSWSGTAPTCQSQDDCEETQVFPFGPCKLVGTKALKARTIFCTRKISGIRRTILEEVPCVLPTSATNDP